MPSERIQAFTFTGADFERMTEDFDVFKYDIKDALRKACKVVTREVNEDLFGDMKRVTGMKASVFKNRIRMRFAYNSGTGTVWIGLNDIPLKRLDPRQNRQGVKAGPVFRKSAFIANTLGGQVFRRKGPERLPIEVQTEPIRDKGEESVARVTSHIQERFMRVLSAELYVTATKRRK